MKNSYAFDSRDDWINYALLNMKKIKTHRPDNDIEKEIWLVCKRGVLGKWSDGINQGYIEEYRDESRLTEECRIK